MNTIPEEVRARAEAVAGAGDILLFLPLRLGSVGGSGGRSANRMLRKHWSQNHADNEDAQYAALWAHSYGGRSGFRGPCDR